MKHIVLALGFGLFTLIPLMASAESTVGPASTSASVLQLKYFLAAVKSKPGSLLTTQRMMTPFIVPFDASLKVGICKRLPRVTEALVQYFLKNPAPVDRRLKVDIAALEKEKKTMAAYVNRAIGARAVSAVYIIEGGKTMSTGTASRFPGASANACGEIIDAYDKQLKAVKNKH